MSTKNFIKLNDILVTTTILFFSIFINRSITFNSHSLGKNLETYSLIFPSRFDILQPQRFLLPLLGKVTNINIQILNIIFLFLLTYLVLIYTKKNLSTFSSLLLVASLSTTMFFQFHLNFGGYPDILSYLFLFLCYSNRDKKLTPYIFFFLALLAKETVIFTIFFFYFLKELNKLKLFTSIFAYIPIYLYFSTGVYSLDYYLNPLYSDFFYWFRKSYEHIYIGYFSSIKFFWATILYLLVFRLNKQHIPIIFLILGTSLQFFLGGDTTRFTSFMFLGIIYIFEIAKFKNINFLLFLILFLNIITPKYYVFAYGELTVINETMISFFDIYNILQMLINS